MSLARNTPAPSKQFLEEMQFLHAKLVEAGGDDMWLNGKTLMDRDIQPLKLLSLLREERDIMNRLTGLGISSLDAIQLLKSSNVSAAYLASESVPPVFDASDRIERQENNSSAIAYWNDIEAPGDARYSRWSPELHSILRPMYPGSFPMIRRNLFNVILALDLERLDTIRFLSETIQMATSKVALRWGIVPIGIEDPESTSTTMAKYFWLAYDRLGPSHTAKFLRRLAYHSEGTKIDLDRATKELDKILGVSSEERQELLAGTPESHLHACRRWSRRLRATNDGPGHVFFNGYHIPFHRALIQSLSQLTMMQVQTIAPQVSHSCPARIVPCSFFDLADLLWYP